MEAKEIPNYGVRAEQFQSEVSSIASRAGDLAPNVLDLGYGVAATHHAPQELHDQARDLNEQGNPYATARQIADAIRSAATRSLWQEPRGQALAQDVFKAERGLK